MSYENNALIELFTKEFNKINIRFDMLDSRLDKIESRLDKVESRLNKVESRLDKLENQVDILKVKQDKTASKLDDLQLQVTLFEHNVRNDIHLLKDATETIEHILQLNHLLPLKPVHSV